MISIKRYLNAIPESSSVDLLSSMLDAYRSALTAMGLSAAQASPSVSQGLERTLTGLGNELSGIPDPALVSTTNARVTQELQHWGDRARADLQQKTQDVKELLVVLAQTATGIASNDERYAKQFEAFRERLEGIANLEDLTQVRTSLVRSAAELKSYVETMSEHARTAVTHLQAEVVGYQVKLEQAEQLAARDSLTGLFNRAKVEAEIERRIAGRRPFSVAMIDLDNFKEVNDQLGHVSGDDLLKQFAGELRSNTRPGDDVGRWGGDEFVVVLDCSRLDALALVQRLEKWVVGDHAFERLGRQEKVRLKASIGLAEWSPGQTGRELIDQPDAEMYKQKAAR